MGKKDARFTRVRESYVALWMSDEDNGSVYLSFSRMGSIWSVRGAERLEEAWIYSLCGRDNVSNALNRHTVWAIKYCHRQSTKRLEDTQGRKLEREEAWEEYKQDRQCRTILHSSAFGMETQIYIPCSLLFVVDVAVNNIGMLNVAIET